MKTCLFFVFFSLICLANESELTIRVDFEDATLLVLEEGIPILNLPVALPRIKHKLPAVGTVKKVEINAHWYPTKATREAYLKRTGEELPSVIPPGHKLNAIGIGKMHINWESRINPLIMIHGTNDPASIGERVTRGCIRLRNEDFLQLKEVIKDRQATVLFE